MTKLEQAARDLRRHAFASPWSPSAMVPPTADDRRDLEFEAIGLKLRLQITYTPATDTLHVSFSDRAGKPLPEEIVQEVLRAVFLPEERPEETPSPLFGNVVRHYVVRCPLRLEE
jgi:hypothetical protein